MDIQNFFLGIVSIVNLSLAVLIYLRSSKKSAQMAYSVFTFFVGLWAFTLIMFRCVADLNIAILWMKLAYIAATGIACSFLYFILSFPEQDKIKDKKNKLFIFIPTIIIAFLLLSSKFLVKDVIIETWGKEIITVLWGHILFALYFVIFFFGAIVIAGYKYLHSLDVVKAQLRYIFMGVLIPGIIGAFFNLAVPLLWGTHRLVWLGPPFTIIMVLCIAYAITRYRLMDIRIAVRKGVIYFLAAVFSYGFFYFCVWLLTHLFGSVYDHGALFLGIFIAICFVSLFFLFEKIINEIVNKHLFGILYNQHETLRELSQRLTTIIDFKKLISDVMNVMKETLAVDRIAFALKIDDDGFKIIKYAGFKKNEINYLLKNEELKKYFPGNNKPLTIEELDGKKFNNLKNDILKFQADFLLPLISKNKLQGVIILGKKISGDAFSKEDLSLLETLSHQAALAIENAKLYDKLEEWNETLKEKVDEQTKDIRGKNVRLKKLLDLRTEFLRVASHQLRTPVSAIKGLVSMLKDGDFENETPEIKQNAFNGIFKKTQKMTNILDDILAAAELDTDEKFKLTRNTLMPVDIVKITEKVMEEVRDEAKGKGIEISIKQENIKTRKQGSAQESAAQLSGVALAKNPPAPFAKGGNKESPLPPFSKGETMYSPTLTKGGNKEYSLPLFSKEETMYSPSLTEGGNKKSPLPPFSKGETMYSPSLTNGGNKKSLLPPFSKGETMYSPPLTKGDQGGFLKECFVLSNEGDLRHILINLLDNAVTYTPKGGKIEIGIESRIKNYELGMGSVAELEERIKNGEGRKEIKKLEPDTIIWSVKDNGIGIPKASQKFLFEKFRRGKNANNMNCDGSGLGLFIVKKLIDAHPGGEVGFTSKENEGSEFWVKFREA